MAEYRILLVDDEESVLNSLKRALRQEPCVIFTALSAEEAVSIVETQSVDLVICDYQLGGMNGLEFLEKILRDYPEIITILLTGHAELNVAIEAINKAILYKFIVKPWNNDDLRVTVKRGLEYRALLAENRKLLNKVKRRDEFIEQLEKENPGITKINRDEEGRIILDL
ncbi:MAG: response regulator [Candidatus Omnitrophota bacterium]